MNNKVFRKYTGSFFDRYTFVPVGGKRATLRQKERVLTEPFEIVKSTIYVQHDLSIDQMVSLLIPVLLKKEGKSCLDLQKHVDGFILADKTRLPKAYPAKFLLNSANSCAIDSVIFILFFMDHSFFLCCSIHFFL